MTAPTPSTSQATEKKKRKASFIEPSFTSTSKTSTAVPATLAPRVPNAIYQPTASQMIEVAEEADADEPEEDEPPEELYTTLNTNIVGVQYYKGYMRRNLVVRFVLTPRLGLVGYGEQVKLERQPSNQYDRYVLYGAYMH